MTKTDKPELKSVVVDDGRHQRVMSRWARRKQAVQKEQYQLQEAEKAAAMEDEKQASLPEDADMPSIESLTEDSDFSGFMSPKVSEDLRKMALRKLFHSSCFNVCDGLDDYDEDFTTFEKLGNIITADIKHRFEMEARDKKMRAEDEEEPSTQSAQEQVGQEEASEPEGLSSGPEGDEGFTRVADSDGEYDPDLA